MVIHVKEAEEWSFHESAFFAGIAALVITAVLFAIIYLVHLSAFILGWLWGFAILAFVLTIIVSFSSFLHIFQPTDVAVKLRIKQFTKKVYDGGIGFAIPRLEKIIVYDSRIQTIWLKFVGIRGTNRVQMKDLDNYKRRVLTIDENIYWVEKPEEKFKNSDFHEFGALMTAGREELNVLCSINYKIIDPLKLSKVFDQLENSETEKSKFKGSLVTKIASALRSTMARMTLDEIFEERQKLMELLIRDSADVKDDWGLEVLNVSIEEMWLEDEKLQDMLDERKKFEIIGDAQQLREEHEAEMRNIIVKADEDAKTMFAKSKDEAQIIQQRTQQDIAQLQQELVKLQAEIDIISVDTQAKGKELVANASAERKKMIDEVTDEKILLHEFVKVLPQIIEQISFEEFKKFILIPDKRQGLLTAGVFGMHEEEKEEE